MTKETRTFSLDPDNDEFLANHDNASALVNDLITQYREGADRNTVALELQIEQKRRAKESKAKEVERLDDDIEELEQLKEEFQNQKPSGLEEAKDALTDTPRKENNPAIQNWASRLGMAPEELIKELD